MLSMLPSAFASSEVSLTVPRHPDPCDNTEGVHKGRQSETDKRRACIRLIQQLRRVELWRAYSGCLCVRSASSHCLHCTLPRCSPLYPLTRLFRFPMERAEPLDRTRVTTSALGSDATARSTSGEHGTQVTRLTTRPLLLTPLYHFLYGRNFPLSSTLTLSSPSLPFTLSTLIVKSTADMMPLPNFSFLPNHAQQPHDATRAHRRMSAAVERRCGAGGV